MYPFSCSAVTVPVFQSDVGGSNFLLEDNWTTFAKARLNCSLAGSYPFYFNELQSTHFSVDEQLIYAVFTTSPLVYSCCYYRRRTCRLIQGLYTKLAKRLLNV